MICLTAKIFKESVDGVTGADILLKKVKAFNIRSHQISVKLTIAVVFFR